MEWTNEIIFEFLELLESDPVLWNLTLPQHKNRINLREAWSRLAAKFQDGKVPIKDLKKKRIYLFSTYRKLKNKVEKSKKKSKNDYDIYRPEWPFYNNIAIMLDSVYKPRKCTTARKVSEESEDSSDDTKDSSDGSECYEPRQKRSRKETEFQTPKEMSDVENVKSQSETPQKDVCTMYCDLLAEKLRLIEENKREEAMLKIDNMVFNIKRQGKDKQQNGADTQTQARLPRHIRPITHQSSHKIQGHSSRDSISSSENDENLPSTMLSDCSRTQKQTLEELVNFDVEEALLRWLVESNSHVPISRYTLMQKAKFIYKNITKKNDFRANKSWMERFKSRHGVRFAANGKMRYDKKISFKTFKLGFLKKVKTLNLCPSRVYSVTVSGLFWRITPRKSYVSFGDNCDQNSMVMSSLLTLSKERVTILTCANAAGTHALKLLIVGECKNPKEFNNIDLPVHYYAQEIELNKKYILKKWFEECFVPEVTEWLKDHNLPQNALLLLDDDSVGMSTDDKRITAMSFPPKCSEHIQLMKQQTVQFIKQDYKKKLLLTAVAKQQPVTDTLDNFNMKDLVFSLCQSWKAVQPLNISSSWKTLWPDIPATSSSCETQQVTVSKDVINQVATEININSHAIDIWFRGTYEEEKGFYEMSDVEIIDRDPSAISIDDHELNLPTSQVWIHDPVKSIDLCLQWAEEHGSSSDDLLVLRNLRDKAMFSRLKDK